MLLLAGCGGEEGSGRNATLAVYVSLPLSGERAAEGRAVGRGIRIALRESGGRAGGHELRAVFLDDTGGGESWSLSAAAGNARRAARDSSAVGFVGDLDSGATRASLPITNQAGIVQIAPAPAARDLVHRVSEELTPERYRPSGDQTFLRLFPVDEDLEPCRGFVGSVRFERGGPAAALGYEAMRLLLDAVAEAGSDREAVREEVLAARRREAVFGAYEVDPDGDVRLAAGCP